MDLVSEHSGGAVDFVREFRSLMARAVAELADTDARDVDRLWGAASPRRIDDVLRAEKAALWNWRDDWDANRRAVALLQLVAARNGCSPGRIDGVWGPRTDAAYQACLDKRGPALRLDFEEAFRPLMALGLSEAEIDRPAAADQAWGAPADYRIVEILESYKTALSGWRRPAWDARRRAVALVQLVAKENACDPGAIDGVWGAKTDAAYAACLVKRDGRNGGPIRGPVVGGGRPIDFAAEYDGLLGMAMRGAADARLDALDKPWTETTARTVDELLTRHTDWVVGDWTAWSADKRAIAALQVALYGLKLPVGAVDGVWGEETAHAYDAAVHYRLHGDYPDEILDEPFELAEEIFPYEEMATRHQNLLKARWGDIGDVQDVGRTDAAARRRDRTAARAFEAERLGYLYSRDYADAHNRNPRRRAKISDDYVLPYPIIYAYDGKPRITRMRMHKDVLLSTNAVLKSVAEAYGLADIERLGLNVWGGAYMRRPMRTSGNTITRWSLHAFGVAHDWNPSLNGMDRRRPHATLSAPECRDFWRIWEEAGWWSFGRHRDKDWMHVQAAKRVRRAPALTTR